MQNTDVKQALLVSALLAGCSTTPDPLDGFTTEEWQELATLGPLGPLPPEPTNRYADDAAAAVFGQRLYFERGYSGPLVVGDDGSNGGLGVVGESGKVSCASCHIPKTWSIDTRSKPDATSVGGTWTFRNTTGLVNASYYSWFGLSGGYDSTWMRDAIGPEIPSYGGGNRLQYAHLMFAKYRADYDAVFPVALDAALDPAALDASRFPAAGKPKHLATDPDGPWEMMTEADRQIVNTIMANSGKAMDAYQRRFVSGNSPVDRYIAGDVTALQASAKRGLHLFIGKAGCVTCHHGTAFSDEMFYNTGVVQAVGVNVPMVDKGRFDSVPRLLASIYNGAGAYSDDPVAGAARLAGLTQADSQLGQFRPGSLRDIAMTAPYMHNGSLPTLEAVVEFYDVGGGADGFSGTKDPLVVPLGLTSAEKADLVELLRSLTGDDVPDALKVDTSAP